MNSIKIWSILLSALLGIGIFSATVAMSAPIACATISAFKMERLSDRFFIPADSSDSERKKYRNLVTKAQQRIKGTFGEPLATPIVVFFKDPDAFWPLKINSYGQTPTIGKRACLLIGPKGQNTDIVAHELVHAEILHRVGAWIMLQEIPSWFDEGVAMQVDYRERYNLGYEQMPDSSFVREIFSYRSFFEVANSYAAAKREVSNLLDSKETPTLFEGLKRVKNGESFAEVFKIQS